jgi:hypothetical protein
MKPMRGQVVDRRTFTLEAALAILGGVTISISGCRERAAATSPDPAPTSTPAPAPTPVPLTDKTGVFLANHGHTAVITAAQLTAGGDIRLDIRGTANHPHVLELTAAEITAIANNGQVGKDSTEEKGHTHFVTFN